MKRLTPRARALRLLRRLYTTAHTTPVVDVRITKRGELVHAWGNATVATMVRHGALTSGRTEEQALQRLVTKLTALLDRRCNADFAALADESTQRILARQKPGTKSRHVAKGGV